MYTVVPCVNFIVRNSEGKVLMGHREDREGKIYRNLWDIPGGKIEENEDIISAVRRELKEETNLELQEAKLLDIFHHAGSNIEGLPGVVILFEVKVIGKISANDDIKDLVWLDYNEIKKLALTPWTKYFLHHLRFNLNQ